MSFFMHVWVSLRAAPRCTLVHIVCTLAAHYSLYTCILYSVYISCMVACLRNRDKVINKSKDSKLLSFWNVYSVGSEFVVDTLDKKKG